MSLIILTSESAIVSAEARFVDGDGRKIKVCVEAPRGTDPEAAFARLPPDWRRQPEGPPSYAWTLFVGGGALAFAFLVIGVLVPLLIAALNGANWLPDLRHLAYEAGSQIVYGSRLDVALGLWFFCFTRVVLVGWPLLTLGLLAMRYFEGRSDDRRR